MEHHDDTPFFILCYTYFDSNTNDFIKAMPIMKSITRPRNNENPMLFDFISELSEPRYAS